MFISIILNGWIEPYFTRIMTLHIFKTIKAFIKVDQITSLEK